VAVARLRPVRGGRTESASDGFEVVYLDNGNAEVRCALDVAANIAFEHVRPVRSFPSYKGQRNYPGLYYAATMDAHVEFESWLERDEAMALDFSPEVVAFAAQPFWLFWPDTDRVRSHAPDFFARDVDGAGIVVDCRPAERIKPRDEAIFDATRRACELIGWQYRLVTGHDPVWLANVRWLAGYKHSRHFQDVVVARLLATFTKAQPLLEGVAKVGDPIAVLPVLYHLLWTGRLRADLADLLQPESLISAESA
jgi:hypothetical protein